MHGLIKKIIKNISHSLFLIPSVLQQRNTLDKSCVLFTYCSIICRLFGDPVYLREDRTFDICICGGLICWVYCYAVPF